MANSQTISNAIALPIGSGGDDLINNSIGPNAQPVTAAEIVSYLDEAPSGMLDVDGNSNADALTDGLLFIRFLFGFTGEAFISGAIGPLAARSNASDIFNFLQHSTCKDIAQERMRSGSRKTPSPLNSHRRI